VHQYAAAGEEREQRKAKADMIKAWMDGGGAHGHEGSSDSQLPKSNKLTIAHP